MGFAFPVQNRMNNRMAGNGRGTRAQYCSECGNKLPAFYKINRTNNYWKKNENNNREQFGESEYIWLWPRIGSAWQRPFVIETRHGCWGTILVFFSLFPAVFRFSICEMAADAIVPSVSICINVNLMKFRCVSIISHFGVSYRIGEGFARLTLVNTHSHSAGSASKRHCHFRLQRSVLW